MAERGIRFMRFGRIARVDLERTGKKPERVTFWGSSMCADWIVAASLS